jgi:hypothetical protein
MDQSPTRVTLQFDPERLAALPDEAREEHDKFLRELGLKPGWVAPGAPITIDIAEHLVVTRCVLTPEGTDGRTANPDTIEDGNGLRVLDQAHTERYDGEELPEVPPTLRFALVDNEQRATGRLGEL